METARGKLETELVNTLFKHKTKIPFEDIKAQITIILSNYDIEQRKTEVTVWDEDINQKYLACFLASKAAGGRTERTLHSYRNYLNKIFDKIGKNCNEISSDDIKLYLAKKLRVDKITKTSVDNERRALSTFYAWMHNNGYINRNPMNTVEVMKYSKPKKKAFSDLEVELLRNECATERETMIVEVLLSTWCRVSELCAIKIDEIETDKIVVHGKGEKDRTVFLNAKSILAIKNYLDKRHDDNPYLLPKLARNENGAPAWNKKGNKKCRSNRWYEDSSNVDASEPTDKGTVEKIIRDLGKRAGIKNAHPHRFRRTGATFALRAGMPFMTVSKLLGHANISVTQVYLDINDEDLESEHGKYVR